MRITGTSPLTHLDPVTSTTRTAPADLAPAASRNPADYLTESDESFLLNGPGVTITSTDNGGSISMTTTKPVSDEESVALMTAARQLVDDRRQGRIQGDVSPAHLEDLLARAEDDSSKAFQAVLQRGLDHLAKGSPVKHVDTQA